MIRLLRHMDIHTHLVRAGVSKNALITHIAMVNRRPRGEIIRFLTLSEYKVERMSIDYNRYIIPWLELKDMLFRI